ncbi:hypothetical protein [Methanocella arvoryzae]|uniref:Peptidase M50 domain-containing protein n=1 Tax=Methanocella arvoryzae (strain DSM 22066 / NBRC 105507 / MRE50) TaxID=351160 RepID=Q0W7T8_METAR|nr:hypothetical protein [Methanocella arvoryzae]CAJ35555.1 hypothetical protein RCIA2 [Methanocella arvoryzae MRE50]
MGYKVGSIAIATLSLAAVLIAANFCYGLIHESAHAVAVKALGGEVFALYVNPIGLDAYMEHSPVAGTGYIALELAGLCATTVAAVIIAMAGKEAVPAFFALRTTIYSMNYSPGTDMANLQAALGSDAFLISIVLVTVNALALAIALRGRYAPLTGLFSSLWRGSPQRNSGE